MSYENADKVEGESLSLGSQTLDSAAKALQVVVWISKLIDRVACP